DVVIIVPLIEFRTFYGWMIIVPVKGQYRFSDQLRAVGGHLLGHQQAVDTSPAAGKGMHQVRLAVVIPQRRGINESLPFLNQRWLGPLPGGIIRFHHVDTKIGIAPVDIKFPVMVPKAWGPDAFLVTWRFKML